MAFENTPTEEEAHLVDVVESTGRPNVNHGRTTPSRG